jgi:hypothetical protein
MSGSGRSCAAGLRLPRALQDVPGAAGGSPDFTFGFFRLAGRGIRYRALAALAVLQPRVATATIAGAIFVGADRKWARGAEFSRTKINRRPQFRVAFRPVGYRAINDRG